QNGVLVVCVFSGSFFMYDLDSDGRVMRVTAIDIVKAEPHARSMIRFGLVFHEFDDVSIEVHQIVDLMIRVITGEGADVGTNDSFGQRIGSRVMNDDHLNL